MAITHKAPVPGAYPPSTIDNTRGILLMLAGFFLFSMVDTGAKFLTDGLHPVQIVWTRQLGLLACVGVFLWLRGPGILCSRAPGRQVLRGAVAAGSALLFVVAVAYVPLADAVAVSFVAPFMVTIMGAMILRERVGPRRWTAVIIGFLAMLMVVRPGMGVIHPAAFLVVVAAGLFAVRQVISRMVSGVDPLETTVAYTAITASVLLTLPLPFVWQSPSPDQMLILFGMAALAGLAELMVIKALDIGEAVVLSPMHYSLMIWGVFWGWLVFGQLPDGWTWAGAAVIIATGLYTIHRERLAASKRT